jgi:NAD(P)-dependent dehydrogenase (short-subunit alcohol dehydrogenase family)
MSMAAAPDMDRQRSLERRGLRPGLRVLVTGGAGGIGLEIARACLAEGARVFVCDVPDALRNADLPPELGRCAADVSRADDVDRLFDTLQSESDGLGGLDVLVNNAAITGPNGPIESNDPAHWAQTIQVNLLGFFHCIRRAVPLLRQAGGGSIVNLSSIAGRLGFPNRSAYAASKWAIVGLTQSVAMEVGVDNIRVNAIQPGIVAGARLAQVQHERALELGISDEEMERRYVSNVSMQCKIEAREVADMVIHLCSEAGRSISGRSIGVCGNVETMRRG